MGLKPVGTGVISNSAPLLWGPQVKAMLQAVVCRTSSTKFDAKMAEKGHFWVETGKEQLKMKDYSITRGRATVNEKHVGKLDDLGMKHIHALEET